MKTKFLTLTVIAAMVFNSCEKTEVKTQASTDSTLNEIIELSISYINTHRTLGDQDRLSDRWKRILSRDCEGALAGGVAGATAGSLAGPGGVGIGALIGGLLGGAGASLDAAIGEGISGPSGPIGFWDPMYDIDMYALIGNGENPYDYIGFNHYDMIQNYALSAEGDISEDLYPFYTASSSHIDAEFDPAYDIETIYSYSDFETTVSSTIGIEDMESEIQTLYDAEQISYNVYYVLSAYSEVYDVTTQEDIEDFIVYSTSAENIVSNTRSINDLDKQLILGTMATARYGAQYWNFFIFE